MPPGRKRKHDPSIPAHVDQQRLPRGIYWDRSGNGRWYVLDAHPEGGRPQRKTVAGPMARLSDLHAIVEARAGTAARGTLDYLCEAFEKSTEFRELATSTKRDYQACAAFARGYPTKLGLPFGQIQTERLTTPVIQRLVEEIAAGHAESRPGAGDARNPTPSKANHVLRYLRRLFAWGIRFGHCTGNPARGVREAKERKQRTNPELADFAALLAFAWDRGQRVPHSEGSVSPYLAPVMELAYACRLRGIEVLSLTDASALEAGIYCERRKGSLDTITTWTPRLRAVWAAAVETRRQLIEKHRRPVPLRPEDRVLFVSQDGTPLRKSSLDTAWQRLVALAIKEKVITPEQRFSLHGLKRRGVTDTPGTKAEKRDASGHATEAAFRLYDAEVAIVPAAAKAEFSGAFYGASGKTPCEDA